MNSINYYFLKKPKNIDDCLDLTKIKSLKLVEIELISSEIATEIYICKIIKAVLTWVFVDRIVKVEKILGNIILSGSKKQQLNNIKKAESRLYKIVNKISGKGITLTGNKNPSIIASFFDKEKI